MNTAIAAPPRTKTPRPDRRPARRRPRRRTRFTAVAGATVAALALWATAELVLGIDLRSPAMSGQPSQDIGVANVAIAAITASFAGWGLLAVLERLTSRARGVWTAIAVVVLLLSFGAPLTGAGITPANQTVLLAMHAGVAAVLIPVLRRSSTRVKDATDQGEAT